jgi:hypothetical protein
MAHKEELRHELKLKSLALSSLLNHSKAGVTHCMDQGRGRSNPLLPCACRRKKVIRSLDHNGQMLVDESRKAEALFDFFDDVLGTLSQRHREINLDLLDLPQLNLSTLSERFTEQEVLSVIHSLPLDKAPGLDGFTTRFL